MLGIARQTEQSRVVASVEILQRWIAILEGRAEHGVPKFSFDLSGNEGRRNENERGLFHLFEISLLYFLEDYQSAVAHIDHLPGNKMLNGYFGVYYAFFSALVLAKLGERAPGRSWLRAFRRHRRLVDKEALQAPQNYRHKAILLAAVEARARGRDNEASRMFELAVTRAREDGFLQNAAIAAELAGEHLQQRGEAIGAARRFREARLWYHQWGCLVKIGALDRRHRQQSGERSTALTSAIREDAWPSNAGAVLEAARALSGETDPARLAQRLMRSIVEHTRATRGVLLMREEGVLNVAFETRTRSEAREASVTKDKTADLPQTIVNYVDRLGTPLRMVSDSEHDLFGRDPYMERHPQAALLCVPLVNMRQRLGVLFLERDGDGAAFARRDLSTAEILASQAAATLTNVREYSERLAALQNQMHPHFLFNALSGIAELTVADPLRAERAILDLAGLYRNILVTSRQPAVSLRQELDLAESYLALEKVRFGPRLSFHFEVRGDATTTLIPPLIVQPIVENSVNHGIALKPEGGLVSVEATITDKRVHIRVTDSGVGWNATGGGSGRGAGLGLRAVRRRLELFFGKDAELIVNATTGVAVDIFFPVRLAEPARVITSESQ